MNVEKNNKQIYYYESFIQNENKIDLIGNKYPTSKDIIKKCQKNNWNGQFIFCKKLYKLQLGLYIKPKMEKVTECVLCGDTLSDEICTLKNYNWKKYLIHYIFIHNYLPSIDFIEIILGHYVSISSSGTFKLPSLAYNKQQSKDKYIKIDKNQFQILDALMMQGAKKIYEHKDTDNKISYKYSEHSGTLKLNSNNKLESFLISSESTKINKDDSVIFFPDNMMEAFDAEYIFHTHPPTDGILGRLECGVLYEFPSGSDILHFIEHSFFGITKGSIVITPEGVYIILKKNQKNGVLLMDKKEKEEFKKKYNNLCASIQNKFINYYSKKYKNIKRVFFEKIIKDKKHIVMFNEFLIDYNIVIKYYPRVKNINDDWIMDTLYLKN
jgi:hypothetical protein